MNDRRKLFGSVLSVVLAAMIVSLAAVYGLYRISLSQQRDRLVDIVDSYTASIHARGLSEWQSGFDSEQVVELNVLQNTSDTYAHTHGMGRTGEFTLAKREGAFIRFLLAHRHGDLANMRVYWEGTLAEPMRRALSGKRGTVIAPDYRGETVVAAYQFIPSVKWGIVGKIDLAEIRQPFVVAAVVIGVIELVLTALAFCWFRHANVRLFRRLETSEIQNETILNAVADGVVIIEGRGTVSMFNKAAEHIFGCVAADVIGKNVSVLMPQPYCDEHDEYLQAYRRSGAKHVIGMRREVVGQRADGSTFPMDIHIGEVEVGAEKIFCGIVTDITERKRIEDEMSMLARFPQENPYPVLRISHSGKVLYANHASRPILQVLNVAVGEQLPDRWRQPVETTLKRSVVCELEIGTGFDDRVFLLSFAPIVAGDYVYVYGRDITDPKRAERELRRAKLAAESANQSLAGKIDELETFNRLAVGRELRMIELKEEVNTLLEAAGRTAAYDIVTADLGP